MRALPLAEYELFRATDFGEAKDALFRSWRPHHLERVGGSSEVDFQLNGVPLAEKSVNAMTSEVDFQLNGVPLAEMSVNAMTFGAEVVSDIAPLGMYAILMSVSGECAVRANSQEITVRRGRTAVLSETDRIRMHWSSDCVLLIFGLDAAGMERHLSDILDVKLTDPVRFELEMDIRAGRGRDLYRRGLRPLVERLERRDNLVDDRYLVDDSSVVARYEAFIMRTLLMAQPNNYTERLRSLRSE